MSEDARPREPGERFGPNGAVMDAMSEGMRSEYERADYGLDFELGDAIPTVIGVALTPFVVRSDLAVALGATWGGLIVGAAGLYAAIDLARVRAIHPANPRQRQRWSKADWRTRLMQVVISATIPLGMAAVLANIWGR